MVNIQLFVGYTYDIPRFFLGELVNFPCFDASNPTWTTVSQGSGASPPCKPLGAPEDVMVIDLFESDMQRHW